MTVVNASTITVTAPAHAAGAVNVIVTAPSGTATVINGYMYVAPPSITGISPPSGPVGGGTSVTISGTNFAGPATVSFGGNAATNVTVVNANTIMATTPSGVAGTVNMVVTTPGGSATSPTQYTYLVQPSITGVSPNIGPTAGGMSVTISGTNFTGVTTVTFGGAAATNVTVVNPTTITVTTPTHAAGSVNVVVTAPSGTATVLNGYTYAAPPSITGISPPSGSTAGGTFVTISGTNFNAPVTVTFAGNTATNVTLVNTNTITVNTPPGLAGAVNVVVTTPGGSATSPTQYTYLV